MCFSDSGGEGRSSQPPRPIELSEVCQDIRHVKTLDELRYGAFWSGTADNPATPGGRQIHFYAIHYNDPDDEDPHIALLGACEEMGQLIVTEMYTERDPRGERERPRAAAILLSFWHHHLRQAIQDLRTIFIPVVTDDSMDAVRQQIYGRMGLELGQRLVIRRGGEPGERDAFKKVSSKTKFGRCVRLIEEHNQAMKEAEIKVSAFKFNPRDEGGFYYDFVVEFRASSRHHQGGHRTSRRSSDPRRR